MNSFDCITCLLGLLLSLSVVVAVPCQAFRSSMSMLPDASRLCVPACICAILDPHCSPFSCLRLSQNSDHRPMSSSLPSSSSPRSSSSSLLVTSPLAPIFLTPSMTLTTNALLSANSIAPTPRKLMTPSAVLSNPVVDARILAPLTSVRSLSRDRTSLDAGISSDACANSISASSNQ